MTSIKRKQSVFLALVVAVVLSFSLAACQTVEDKVGEEVDKVEKQVVTEAKKLVWSQVNEGLDKLKETIKSDEKGGEWARSEVAKIREGIKTALSTVGGEDFAGLEWVDQALQELEEKLADDETADQLIESIDEFIEKLETRLDLGE